VPRLPFIVALFLCGASASPQLRIATWNITLYNGGRDADIKNAVYGVFNGLSMSPDVIITQEFISSAAADAFVGILNSAPGSPGDWASAPFINGPDTDSEFFYRTGKVDFLGVTVVAVGGTEPNHPRNIQRYDMRPKTYTGTGATLACYSSHMKAQEAGSSDEERRLLEAQRIRADAETLDGRPFVLGGDFNIQTSSEAAYQELVGSQPDNSGRFFDPIKTPGSWNNNEDFRFVHTQDPANDMDDRFDQLLLSANLVDGTGFEYVGNPNIAYSTTTWNDPNHSYRAWGNDGTSFGAPLTVMGNTMVGAAIAADLVDICMGNGHLPVFLDLRVPPKAEFTAVVNFGAVPFLSQATEPITMRNGGDVSLWTAAGIADLIYHMTTTGPFTAPGLTFTAVAGAQANNHELAMDTSAPGVLNGSLTFHTNAPDSPTIALQCTGEVYYEIGPETFAVAPGSAVAGDLNSLQASDDNRLHVRPGVALTSTTPPAQLAVSAHAPFSAATRLRFFVESSATTTIQQSISLYNFQLGSYEQLDLRGLSSTDTVAALALLTGASDYLDSASGEVRARVAWKAAGPVLVYPWLARVDHAHWWITP
jgi:hypothetical protein